MAEIAPYVRTDYKAVDKRDEVHSVLGWISGNAKKFPIVVDDGRPFGIINDRAMMSRSVNPHAHIEQYTLPTRALTMDATLEQARAKMSEFRAAYLPVEDARGKVAGYIRAIDLAQAFANGTRAIDLAVPVTMLHEEQTMGEALNVFSKEYVDHLPVLRKDGRVSGVLPRRAVLAMGFNAGNKGRKDAGGEKFTILHDPIGGFMDNTAATVPADTRFEALVETLQDSGYAIVSGADGRVAGMVTAETLFRAGM